MPPACSATAQSRPDCLGETEIVSFEPEELFGTKLRALLQLRKNRDLFDLFEGLKQLNLDRGKLLTCFDHYLEIEGTPIHRAAAEKRMLQKPERSLTEILIRFCRLESISMNQKPCEHLQWCGMSSLSVSSARRGSFRRRSLMTSGGNDFQDFCDEGRAGGE
jgi:hypothetical protein